jgi:hypothetical protein
MLKLLIYFSFVNIQTSDASIDFRFYSLSNFQKVARQFLLEGGGELRNEDVALKFKDFLSRI